MTVIDINNLLTAGAQIRVSYLCDGLAMEGPITRARVCRGTVQVLPIGSWRWETLQSYRSLSVDGWRAVTS